MPFEYVWSVVLADCSDLELEAFLDAQKSYVKKNSQHDPCSVCIPRYVEHTMHYVICMCNSTTCSEVSGGQECQWYLKSVMCDSTKRCAIFQHGHHISIVMSPPRVRLSLSMKRFVREQTDAKLMPSRILNKMIDEFSLDTAYDYLPRVQRYSHYYRMSRLADSNNVDDMEALIVTKPYHPNLDEKTGFAYGYPTSPNGDPFLTTGSVEAPFVVGFSCKRLIRNLAHAATHVLHIDATFKLNTCNFPVVMLGVSDSARQFHPVCFFIASDLKQLQIECVARSTVLQYQVITGSLPEIRFVMADADQAQRNAVEAVVTSELNSPSPDFLMCFFHVMKNVKKYATGMSVPRPLKRELAIIDEQARVSEYQLETLQQPLSGWIVDVDASTCECRTWFKLAYCVHLIAARVHVGLHVEGVTKKRKFVNKSTKKKAKGAIVGHALSMV